MAPDQSPTSTPTPETSEELARLARSWRERINYDEIPELRHSPPGRRRRRRKRLSQEQLAALTGYSVGWISSLERGEQQNYSVEFLDAIAHHLRLQDHEKTLLFLLARRETPAVVGESRLNATGTVRRILDAQMWPAYINDEAWDLVAYNAHMREWFPWVADENANVMRWVFTDPQARQWLHRWDTDWAPPMLAQMRFAHARFPDNERLTEVITEILNVNDDARRLWDAPLAYPHPDGDHRWLHLPQDSKPQPIELVALEPLRAPGARLMMLVPLPTTPTALPQED